MEPITNVLVVDDDETSIFLTKRVLRRMGIGTNITTALNGLDGLEALKEAKGQGRLPQLILLDVKMQGMDGFSFLEELGKFRLVNLIDTKVVLLSSSQDPLDIELGYKHMVAEYLSKPLTEEKLRQVIH